eukprot:7910971-Ditylum_brightwellii.AAC.1
MRVFGALQQACKSRGQGFVEERRPRRDHKKEKGGQQDKKGGWVVIVRGGWVVIDVIDLAEKQQMVEEVK